ncbi:MAG TPA: isoleucine--tRNA ligase [Patescibacteria group bacterium]|jgi:isoleucyl-tRNA synthetase|nr:isoleucine--tRNA ligase [Patescibacteria group bacterium]
MFKPVDPQVDFPKLENELLEKWTKEGLQRKYLHRNDTSKTRFSFLDGPITANNPMGVHHAWGRTYKDVWQRFYNMRGFKQRFQNGFDCQGLWVEVEVEKELGVRNKKDIENLVAGDKKASIAKFVQLCKDRVGKYSAIQTEQSKRLGYFMDWDNSYYTMSDENNYMIWHFLKTCNERGWIYKGTDSVPWCPRCETAISQHEMLTEDYKELTHDSIFIEYPLANRKNTYLLAWTTTPWTLPGNVAVAIDPAKDYVEAEGEIAGNAYIVVKEAAERLGLTVKKTFKGKELIGKLYESPFDNLPRVKEALGDYKHKVVSSDPLILPISVEEGTGMVHVAPGQGAEDYRLGKKEKLPMIALIDDEAFYLSDMNEFSSQSAKKHPEIIIEFLKKSDNLFKTEKYTHRYPACWRCKTELVWKVTQEWYIAMDVKEKSGKTLREEMKDTAKMIEWRPEFGLERELDWLSNMSDWLISKKNRYWGLALPVFECECGHFEVIGSKEELQEKAVEGWEDFEGHTPHKPFIDSVKIKCPECQKVVSRVNDVGNVWLDAGIVGFSTLSYTTDKKYWEEWFPADFITESFPGQFKNWFYSMIAMSTVLEKRNSFKLVLGYGSMLGEDGRPMHKSWGNSIDFNEGADKIGVDVMRWMFVTHNPEQNLLFGYKKADETRRKFHLMLWNIYNFFITYANIDGYIADSKWQVADSENALDRWIISRLNNTVDNVTKGLEKYEIQTATLSIETFVNDLSLWYVRRSRDRIGPSAEDDKDKKACYQTLHLVLITLAQLLAPFIPFIAEEIYTNLTSQESVHLSDWPSFDKEMINVGLEEQMSNGRLVVESAHAVRKQAEVKVRIPIREMVYDGPQELSAEVLEIIKSEVNAYNLTFGKKADAYRVLAKTSDDNLDLNFGLARDIVRKIQEERKKLQTQPNEKVKITIPFWPKEHEAYIKRKALISMITEAEEFSVTKDEQ